MKPEPLSSRSERPALTRDVIVTALNAWANATEMGECLLDRLDQAQVLREAATALSERPFMEALGSVLRAQGFNDHDVATIRVDLIAELARPAER